MKILNFNKAGNPADVLRFTEKEKPAPGDNEVLVKVVGSSIQPADIMFIEGHYRFKPEFPQTAGLEGAGIVEASGKNVHDVTGKLVSFFERNAWAEYSVAPKESIVILPDNFPIGKAVQFFLNPFTAWGLLEESKVNAGEWLVAHGSKFYSFTSCYSVGKIERNQCDSSSKDLPSHDENAAIRLKDRIFLPGNK